MSSVCPVIRVQLGNACVAFPATSMQTKHRFADIRAQIYGSWPIKHRSVDAGAFQRGNARITGRIQSVPSSIDKYFQGNFFRRVLWCFISLFMGYYAGNMVSLAFGALAINDVVAAIITVAVTEVISKAFYSEWPSPGLWLIFANFFKMGVTFAFMADAYKLAG
jgi:hypothetical protein